MIVGMGEYSMLAIDPFGNLIVIDPHSGLRPRRESPPKRKESPPRREKTPEKKPSPAIAPPPAIIPPRIPTSGSRIKISRDSLARCDSLLKSRRPTKATAPSVEHVQCERILQGLQRNCPYPSVTISDLLTKTPTGQALVLKGRFQGRDIALKLFLEEDQCFQKEQRFFRLLGSHPNIMSLVKSFNTPRQALVFPLAKQSLAEVVENRALLLPIAIQYGTQILEGLVHIHSNSVAHLDLKCDNILLNERNVAMITDFGLAETYTGSDSISGCGTPPFMAPECFQKSNSLDKSKVDSYAFGMMFYEMIRGAIPWLELFRDDNEEWVHSIANQVVAGQRPSLDSRWSSKVKLFLETCWK